MPARSLPACCSAGVAIWRQVLVRLPGPQGEEASNIYFTLENALAKGEEGIVTDRAGTLIGQYTKTPYATLAALALAKQKLEQGELEAAQAQLQWALDNAGPMSSGSDPSASGAGHGGRGQPHGAEACWRSLPERAFPRCRLNSRAILTRPRGYRRGPGRIRNRARRSAAGFTRTSDAAVEIRKFDRGGRVGGRPMTRFFAAFLLAVRWGVAPPYRAGSRA